MQRYKKKWNIDIFIVKKIMKTIRLTETELKRLVHKVISEQSLPKDMEFSMWDDRKVITYQSKDDITISEILKIESKMKKFIKSLPKGKPTSELAVESENRSLSFYMHFETSMSKKELERIYRV